MERHALLLPLLLMADPGVAQTAFQDSLSAIATRLADRIVMHEHGSVAVFTLLAANDEQRALGEYLTDELSYHLARRATRFHLVERRELDALLSEQRLIASGLVAEDAELRLGELNSASAIITGTFQAVDKKHVRLDLKLMDSRTGAIEGMERSMFPMPSGFEDGRTLAEVVMERQTQKAALDMEREQRSSPIEFRTSVAFGDYFGAWHPALGASLLFRSGHDHLGRLAIGARVQYMPGVGNHTPRKLDFGYYASSDGGSIWNPFGEAPNAEPGDVFLVPANDASFAMHVLSEVLAQGAQLATWQHIHVSEASASRWSIILPLRWYMAGDTRSPHMVKWFLDLGFGADLVRSNNTYQVTSIQLEQEGVLNVQQFSTKDAPLTQGDNSTLFLNGMLGAGFEKGRVGISVEWLKYFNNVQLSDNQMRTVKGDPIAISLLNGEALDSPQLVSEVAQMGGVRFGSTNNDDLFMQGAGMDRFLDRSHVQLTLSIRLFE